MVFIAKGTFLGFSILKTLSSERPRSVSQVDLGMTSDVVFPGMSHAQGRTGLLVQNEQKAWQVSS